jgi:hypothetical protein
MQPSYQFTVERISQFRVAADRFEDNSAAWVDLGLWCAAVEWIGPGAPPPRGITWRTAARALWDWLSSSGEQPVAA